MRHAPAVLLVFMASAGILIVEITAARLLAPILGTSIHVWAAVIAFVLLGLAAGNWLGGRLAERLPRAAAWLPLAFLLAAAGAAGAWAFIAVLPPLAIRPWSVAVPALAFPFALPATAAGLVKPIATALAIARAPDRAGRIIGVMYAANAAGAVLGTLLSGFVFAAYLGLSETMLGTAGVFLAASATMWMARSLAGGDVR